MAMHTRVVTRRRPNWAQMTNFQYKLQFMYDGYIEFLQFITGYVGSDGSSSSSSSSSSGTTTN
ncbi:MAG: hypothetical protein JXO22_04695 [Phycisphaerae bacterium]|nr:hypothetical protein [Phycisphaerae bacterium]